MPDQLETPVALIFFVRDDTFKKVFETVKKAKPKQLFLIQDGPRKNCPKDIEQINKCRKIAENIDWECEVYKNYSDVNLGCGVRPQSGISWVFEHVDRSIILEDDCVPCNSFFRYCEELLNKYENDERIAYISGLNHFEHWDCGESDYFFTKTGSIWGWATWKRAWSKYYDYYISNINKSYEKRIVEKQILHSSIAKQKVKDWEYINSCKQTNINLSYWDTQWGFVKYSQNMLVVVPKYNQISNIGAGLDSTHAQNIRRSTYIKYKTFFYIPTKEFSFPLKHPNCCMCDTYYDDMVYKIIRGNPVRKLVAKYVKKILRR